MVKFLKLFFIIIITFGIIAFKGISSLAGCVPDTPIHRWSLFYPLSQVRHQIVIFSKQYECNTERSRWNNFSIHTSTRFLDTAAVTVSVSCERNLYKWENQVNEQTPE